ncbi:MAG: winged helix-turn-helix domain-containing protein, partial [Lysobacter sp.]|nr:winged helix-turn-helix domain-containing protein [Lysobacter sp.]
DPRQSIETLLLGEGFDVHCAGLTRDVDRILAKRDIDVILLDSLPDEDGLSLCRRLSRIDAPPIMMVTTRADDIDRIVGLELGADDYMTKPFSPRELVARVRALLRRAALAPAPAPAAALFEHDAEGQRIRYAGTWLPLTRLEYGLLRALLRTPGRIRSRDALLDEVWGSDGDATDRTVDTHVKTLRAKLRAVRPELEPIATHRGMGYSLDVPAR